MAGSVVSTRAPVGAKNNFPDKLEEVGAKVVCGGGFVTIAPPSVVVVS